jgi:adenylate kinase
VKGKLANVIIVTGTPGTGKTTFAKELTRAIGADYVNVTKYVSEHKLYSGIDRQRRTKIIDVERTRRRLQKELKVTRGLVVLDTHVPDGIVPKQVVKLVFVVRCNPIILESRLRAKRWKTSKIRENVLAEIIDSCLIVAVKHYGWKKVVQLDTSHTKLKQTLAMAKRSIQGKPSRELKIDWLTELEKNGLLDRYLRA